MTSEQKIQSKIIKRYEKLGWYVLKIHKANKNGVPDLICLKPNDVLFIEVKKPTGVLSKIQEYRIEELSKLNFNVLISTE